MPGQENDDQVVAFHRISQSNKTIRIIGLMAFAGFCVHELRLYLEKGWVDVVIILIGLLLPSGVTWKLYRHHRRYVALHHKRIPELERRLDVDRTSSGLNPDGSCEDDA